MFDLARKAKYWLLCFLSGDGFNAFVKFACYLMSSGTAIYYACLLSRSKEISKMTNVVNLFEDEDRYETWMPKLAPLCAIISLLISFCYQSFAFGMWDESYVEVILLSSYSLSQDLLLWDWKNFTTAYDQLYKQYSDHTATNIVFGILCFIRDFFPTCTWE